MILLVGIMVFRILTYNVIVSLGDTTTVLMLTTSSFYLAVLQPFFYPHLQRHSCTWRYYDSFYSHLRHGLLGDATTFVMLACNLVCCFTWRFYYNFNLAYVVVYLAIQRPF